MVYIVQVPEEDKVIIQGMTDFVWARENLRTMQLAELCHRMDTLLRKQGKNVQPFDPTQLRPSVDPLVHMCVLLRKLLA